MRSKVKEIIEQKLQQVKTIDVHNHLRPEKTSANNIADIMLYHHVRSELVSANMSLDGSTLDLQDNLDNTDRQPRDRVKTGLKYYKNIKNTTLGLFLKWILSDLYGIREEIDEINLEKTASLIEERGRDLKWQEDVFDKYCGIERSITVEEGIPHSNRILKGKSIFSGCLISGMNILPKHTISQIEETFGKSLNTSQDYCDYIKGFIRKLPTSEYAFYNTRILPYLTFEKTTEKDITNIIKKAKSGQFIDTVEIGSFCYFTLKNILAELRETKTNLNVIQVTLGADVLPPHRPITHWSDSCCRSLAMLANENEDFQFNVTSASDIFTQDLGIIAKHIPNISIAGYWWHTLYPFYIKKAVETRLDMIPMNKIIAFFSDAYCSEWCYPKLKLVKEIWAQVLIERVERGWYDIDTVLEIIQKAFYDNPKKIYHIS